MDRLCAKHRASPEVVSDAHKVATCEVFVFASAVPEEFSPHSNSSSKKSPMSPSVTGPEQLVTRTPYGCRITPAVESKRRSACAVLHEASHPLPCVQLTR